MTFLWLLLLSMGMGTYWFYQVQTYHYAAVEAGVLYRDGNRGIREFSTAVRNAHAKTVVSLVDDAEFAQKQFQQEQELLERKGVKLERIAIPLGGWPTKDDVARFLTIVQDPTNRPVLVHCAQGVRRTGMLVAAYQQAAMGMDDARAKAAVLTFGHSRRSIGDVERFIDVYDPKTGEVPDLPKGEE